MENQVKIDILQIITNQPGYLFKIQQIVESGCLDTVSDVVEIHFDSDKNIRKIRSPKVKVYPQFDKKF